MKKECKKWNGKGIINNGKCLECNGTGIIIKNSFDGVKLG